MKLNRTKILKYIESQYPYIDEAEKVMLAESMFNYFKNNIKKSHEKLKKADRLMRMQNEEDDELNLASEGINNPETAARIKAALDSDNYKVIGGVYDVSDRRRPSYPPDANAILAPWYTDYLKQKELKQRKRPITISASEGYYDRMAPDPDSRIPVKPARAPKFKPFLRDLMKGKTPEEREFARSVLRNGILTTALQAGMGRMSRPKTDPFADYISNKLKRGEIEFVKNVYTDENGNPILSEGTKTYKLKKK